MNIKYRVYRPTFTALVTEWLVIIAVLAIALHMGQVLVYILAGVVISTRQHALLMLFHDGVHGLVARNKRFNDAVINALVGIPLLVPVHVYRAIHISHHKHVGTSKDPERLLLYWGQPWNYHPLKSTGLLVQFLGDVTGINSLVMMSRYMMMSRRENELDLPATRFYPELLVFFAVFVSVVVVSLYSWPYESAVALLLWYLPYLTLTQLLQKVRSFAEHSMDEDESYTFNWKPGLLGRLTIWPYNINYHREHHAHPKVPWDRLPLCTDIDHVRPGGELIAHIWDGSN